MPSADSNCCTPTVFCGLTPSCDRFFSLLDLAYFESHTLSCGVGGDVITDVIRAVTVFYGLCQLPSVWNEHP